MKEEFKSQEFGVYRLSDLTELLRVGRSTIYYWIKKGKFPKPIKLGEKTSGWLKKDIQKWLEERAKGN